MCRRLVDYLVFKYLVARRSHGVEDRVVNERQKGHGQQGQLTPDERSRLVMCSNNERCGRWTPDLEIVSSSVSLRTRAKYLPFRLDQSWHMLQFGYYVGRFGGAVWRRPANLAVEGGQLFLNAIGE